MLFIHGEQETGQHDGNHSHRRKAEKERAEKEKAALEAATDTDKSKKGA